MAVAQKLPRLTEAEYLALDRAAEIKSEFYEGEMFAMAGGSRWHSLICSNLIRELSSRLKGTDCVVFTSDLRIKVEATGLQTFPDVSVVCGPQRYLDKENDTLLNPTLLVEVLSDSSEAYDRGKKFEHYRQIHSCREYLLVSQTEPRVEQFVRQSNKDWVLKEAAGLTSMLVLSSVQATVPLAEIFSRVEFQPVPIRPR